MPRPDRAIRQDALIKGNAFLQPRLFLRGGLGQLGLQLCQLGLVFPIAGIGQGFVVCRAEGDFRVCVHGFHIALQEPEGLGGVGAVRVHKQHLQADADLRFRLAVQRQGKRHVATLHIGGIEQTIVQQHAGI